MISPHHMTRSEFIDQIAFQYAEFEKQHEGQQIVPLDRRFAFSHGKGYIEQGTYKYTGGDYRYHMDWQRVATAANKRLPYWRRQVREFGAES
jgi:hypothetical protein